MKYLRTLLTAIFLIAAVNVGYSLPTYFYGNIAINGSGQLIPSTTVDVEVSIYNGLNLLYQETHSGVIVDAFSAFVVEVGTGTVVTGDLASITANVNTKTQARINVAGTWISLGSQYTSSIIKQSITGFSGDPTEIDLPDGEIIIGNALNEGEGHAVSGDATLSNTGVLTIANDAITSAKIADGTIVPSDVDLTDAGWDFTTLFQAGNAVLDESTPFVSDPASDATVSGTYNTLVITESDPVYTADMGTIVYDGDVAGGDLTGTYPSPTLIAVGTADTYGDATTVPVFTTDANGRVTAVTPTAIAFPAETDPIYTADMGTIVYDGDVAGGDLTGTYPSPTLIAVGTADTYGDATTVPVITTDANGRVTAVTPTAIAFPAETDPVYTADMGTIVYDGDVAGGDLTGTYPSPTLIAVGTADTYGDATTVPVITTDANGRVTAVTPTAIAFPAETDPIWTAAEPNYANLGQDETVAGNWTFSNLITGDISGNAGTVTDGLYTTTTFDDAVGSDATVSGTYNTLNLQLGAGVVGTTEIADATEFAVFTSDDGGMILTDGAHAMTITGGTNVTTSILANTLTIDASVLTDGTTILGSGTPGDEISINLANANTWTVLQTFNGGLEGTDANLTGNLTVAGTSTLANTVTIENKIELGAALTGNSYADFLGNNNSLNVVIGADNTGNNGAISVRNDIGDPMAGMFYDNTTATWINGVGDLATNRGAMLLYGPADAADDARIIVANGVATPVFIVDREGDVIANTVTATTFTGNLVGNASTVTNGLYTTTPFASVLGSDATVTGTYNTLAITESDPEVAMTTTNAVPTWDGTALVDGSITDDGISVAVGGSLYFDVASGDISTAGDVSGVNADFTGTLTLGTGVAQGTFNVTGNTALRTYTLPDASGTLALTTDIPAVTLQDAYDNGNTITTDATGDVTFDISNGQAFSILNNLGANDLFKVDASSNYIEMNTVGTGPGTFVNIAPSGNTFTGTMLSIGGGNQNVALNATTNTPLNNPAVYIDNSDDGYALVVQNSSGSGSSQGLYVDNAISSLPAIQIADDGGAVQLATATYDGTVTALDDYNSVFVITGTAIYTAPTPLAGKFIYVINTFTSDITVDGKTVAAGTAVSFVSDGTAWYPIKADVPLP